MIIIVNYNKLIQSMDISQGQKIPKTIVMQQSTLPKEKGPQLLEHSLLKANQIYTNVSKDDKEHNGQTLTLKIDQTFHLYSNNSAWDSRFQYSWNWDSSFTIDGIWSYDKEIQTITLTATKFSASLHQPIQDQQSVIAKGFPNRVISTPNFSLQESKEIKAFVVHWDYHKFAKVGQGKLQKQLK